MSEAGGFHMWATFAIIALAFVAYFLDKWRMELTSLGVIATILLLFQLFPMGGGGSVVGGSVVGGSVVGGSVVGGSVVGGSVVGGSVTGGSVTGGSVASGSFSPGALASLSSGLSSPAPC